MEFPLHGTKRTIWQWDRDGRLLVSMCREGIVEVQPHDLSFEGIDVNSSLPSLFDSRLCS